MLGMLFSPCMVNKRANSIECGVGNNISAGDCSDESMKILVQLLQVLVQVTIQRFQCNLKPHQMV